MVENAQYILTDDKVDLQLERKKLSERRISIVEIDTIINLAPDQVYI